jgi:hypothetical protein
MSGLLFSGPPKIVGPPNGLACMCLSKQAFFTLVPVTNDSVRTAGSVDPAETGFVAHAALLPAVLAWNFCAKWNFRTCYACFLSV